MGTSITATRIRLLRSMHKLTQEALAEKIGANRVTISHYESGAYNPSHDAILKMAEVFNVSSDYLLGRIDNPKRSPNIVEEEKEQAACNDDLWDLRESLRRDPQRRMLFDAARDVRREDIETAVRILEALKGGSSSDTD